MMIAADNIQGLNPVIAQAMAQLNPQPIADLAKLCVQRGAHYIDINPGYLSKRNLDRMAFLVETVQEAVSLPLILDSPHPEILARGLAACRETPILNALSLEERKIQEILPLAVEHDAKLVILLMDERSFSPASVDEKVALALQLREMALAGGMKSDSLIFDPVLPNMSWDDAYFRISHGVKMVRLMAGGAIFDEPVMTIAGLSNLRSGNTSPSQIETTCLALLAGAGLSIALMNVTKPENIQQFTVVHSMINA